MALLPRLYRLQLPKSLLKGFNLAKKVLFITDSLGLPRCQPEPVPAESTWTYMLSSKLPDLFSCKILFYYHCLHGLTTDSIVEHLHSILGAYSPDMVILQVGIVDCYPRAVRKSELAILRRIPLLGKITHWLVRRYYPKLVVARNISYVDIKSFEINNLEILSYYKNIELLVIPIAPPNEAFEKKNPAVRERISKYNEILLKVYGDRYLDGLFSRSDLRELFLSDNYHLSESGNRLLFDKVLEKCHSWLCRA
jgi:lysophospholipase L1-like esterase